MADMDQITPPEGNPTEIAPLDETKEVKPASPYGDDSSHEAVRYLSSIHRGAQNDVQDTGALEKAFDAASGAQGEAPKPQPSQAPKIEDGDKAFDQAAQKIGLGQDVRAAQIAQKTASDQGEGIVGKVEDKAKAYVKQVAGGALDAVQNTWNNLMSLESWGASILHPYGIGGTPQDCESMKTHFAEQWIAPGSSVDENLVRGISSFVVPFVGWAKALRAGEAVTALGRYGLTQAAAAGATVTSTDPNGGNLANLVQQVPMLRNPIAQFLAADPKDSQTTNHFKNVLTGLGVGTLAEGLFYGVSALKNYWWGKALSSEATNVSQGVKPSPENLPLDQVNTGVTPERPGTEPGTSAAENVPVGTKEDQPVFGLRIGRPGEGAKQAILNMSDDIKEPASSTSVNLAKIQGPEDVKQLMSAVDKAFPSEISMAKRGVVPDEQVMNTARQSLADDLGMNLKELNSREIGQAMNAEQITKARIMLNGAAQSLLDSVSAAKNGGIEEQAHFLDALDGFRMIHNQLAGGRAEAGRALRSFQQMAEMPDANLARRIMEEQINLAGGRSSVSEMIDRLYQLTTTGQLSQVADQARFGSNIKDAIWQVYTNSLLSNPRIAMVKAFSDAYNTYLAKPAELFNASVIGKMRGTPEGQRVTFGQLGAYWDAVRSNNMEALQLAWKAAKEGRPVMDDLRLYQDQMGAIATEKASPSETLPQMSQRVLGTMVGLPSRALMGITEFYKTQNFRGSIAMQAVQEAEKMGLSGEAFSNMVERLKSQPTIDMVQNARDFMRQQTFTKQPQGVFGDLSNIIDQTPWLKPFIPFYKVRLNVLQNEIERSPFAPLLGSFRDELRAGGRQADLAWAKMATGFSALSASAYLVHQGVLTGSGPEDPKMRKVLEQSGWQPNSVKIGDKFYAYNRLEPLGGLLGMGADLHDWTSQLHGVDEEKAQQLALMGVGLAAKHLRPDFMVQSLGHLIDAVKDPVKEGPKFIAHMASGLVPYSGLTKAISQSGDPVQRNNMVDPTKPGPLLQSVWNSIKQEIPGASKGLPPVRNIFGEPVVSGPGYGWDSLSPIYTTKQDNSPASKEMIRLGMATRDVQENQRDLPSHLVLSFPPRTITMGKVQQKLTPDEYDHFCDLAGGNGLKGGLEFTRGMNLKDRLNDMVKSGFSDLGPEKDNDYARIVAINKIVSGYRKLAEQQLVGETRPNGSRMADDMAERYQKKSQQMRQRTLTLGVQ